MVDNAVMQLIDVVVEALVTTVVVGASVAVEASVVDAGDPVVDTIVAGTTVDVCTMAS